MSLRNQKIEDLWTRKDFIMLKKISIYKRILMLLVLCTVFLLPVTRCHAEEMQYYTSGMYTYYVINEPEKEISICAISSTAKKIVIPSELDGYQVSRIGYPEGDHYEEAKKLGGDIAQCMEELVISDTVKRVQALSFYECKKLSKVTLPEDIILGYACFSGCDSWKNIVLPQNTFCEDAALPGNIDSLQISNSIFGEGVITAKVNRLLLSPKQNTVFDMGGSWVSVKLKELYSSKQVTKLLFNGVDGENAVEKLYVNGRDTKVEANESRGHAVLGKVSFGEIFTVENAKAISFAKKHKITYHIKKAGKVKKAVCKKKVGKYLYTWKKVKTAVHTFKYNKKWKKNTKEVPTVYKVYGKKTKSGKYRLLAITKAKRYTTECKYIKVVPVQEW